VLLAHVEAQKAAVADGFRRDPQKARLDADRVDAVLGVEIRRLDELA